jgi:uncharacterized protein YjbI with pentapeptide repeats
MLPGGWNAFNGWLIGPGANLDNADLQGAPLTYLYLTDISFVNANLSGAYLNGSDLSRSDLTGATLTGASLDLTYLADSTLTGVKSGSVWGWGISLPTDWQLLDGWLIGPGANLDNAYLFGVNLSLRNLAGASFAGANLTGASFAFTNLTGAKFMGADLSQANLQMSTVEQADFTDALLPSYPFQVFGNPAALPPGWYFDGNAIQPG